MNSPEPVSDKDENIEKKSRPTKLMEFDYDLIVIGSGPSGQRAAIQAAKIGKRAAIIERARAVGGVCVNTGTIPSKTFREAVMHLSGFRERGIYGS
jgi:NAD(P) transhydrogenase